MVRIIAGKAKGCRLVQVPLGKARPTSDRVKEALFNILPDLEGLRFIDLFAGSGNVGLEAMSRGATQTYFVEQTPAMIKLIKNNIEKCRLECRHELLPVSVERAFQILMGRGAKFDIIFADPPYDSGWVEKTVRLLSTGELFAHNALAAIQHSRREALPDDTGMLGLADQRRYGDTLISIFKISG